MFLNLHWRPLLGMPRPSFYPIPFLVPWAQLMLQAVLQIHHHPSSRSVPDWFGRYNVSDDQADFCLRPFSASRFHRSHAHTLSSCPTATKYYTCVLTTTPPPIVSNYSRSFSTPSGHRPRPQQAPATPVTPAPAPAPSAKRVTLHTALSAPVSPSGSDSRFEPFGMGLPLLPESNFEPYTFGSALAAVVSPVAYCMCSACQVSSCCH